jgi:hypothetical protein
MFSPKRSLQLRQFESESDFHEENGDETKGFLEWTSSNKIKIPRWSSNISPGFMITLTVLNMLMLLFSVSLVLFAWDQRQALFKNENNSLLRAVDAYCKSNHWSRGMHKPHHRPLLTIPIAPVYDQVKVPFIDYTINGSLLDHGTSIYRQAPSPEVDAAWDYLTHQLPHAISKEDVVKLGKDPRMTAKWPEEWGFGPESYIAELDIVHTVHCLNAIRRDVHWRHYFGDTYPDGKFPELHRTHTDHCINIILQNLMCNANGDIVTNVWVEGQDHPFPDFNVNKRCRDYNTFIDWHHKTQITDMEKYLEMRIPDDQIPWKMSQKFHNLFKTGLKGGSKDEVLD